MYKMAKRRFMKLKQMFLNKDQLDLVSIIGESNEFLDCLFR